MRAKASAARSPARRPWMRALSCSRATNAARWSAAWCSSPSSIAIVERHWLRCASNASTLRSTCPLDPFDVVDPRRLEEQQRRGPVRREALIGEEVRIARGDDAADHERPRGEMVGMQTVRLPGIVAEDHVGPHLADRGAHLGARGQVVLELAVDAAQEAHVDGAEDLGCVPLLFLAGRDERPEVGLGVPGALRAVGADAQVHLGAEIRPFGQRRAAPELDVVGVGADREHTARHGEVDAEGHGVGSCSWASASRSDASSTSNPSAWSRTTRTSRPHRRASAMWRAQEPGPYANPKSAALGTASTGLPSS